MAQYKISQSIKQLYHIRTHDFQELLEKLPEGTQITVDSLKTRDYPWKADNIFYNYGITTLYELSKFLSDGGNFKELIEITKGSTSQYEADYKIKQYFIDLDDDLDDEEDINYTVPFDELIIDRLQQSIFNKIDIEEDNDEEDTLIISLERNERIRYSTVLSIMNPEIYHPAKSEAYIGYAWGVSVDDEIVLDYSNTVLAQLMKQIPGRNTHGVITVLAINNSFSGNVSFEIDYENDTVVFHNAIIPAILENPLIVQNYIITLRVFNDNETIDVIKPGGGTLTVPRKYTASWISVNGDHFHGVSAEDLSSAHSLDYRTGELLVPEEGVDFISTGCISIVEEDIMMNQENFNDDFYDDSESGYFY